MKEDKYIGVWVKPYNDSLKAQVGRWQHHDTEFIAKTIIDILKINKKDRVLDLCCGNGLITSVVAKSCQEIHGVDFSKNLIEVAERNNKSQNASYYLKSAIDIGELFPENTFDKAYCYAAFQYFNYKNGEQLMESIARVTKQNGLILIGDIPNKEKKRAYYNINTLRKYLGFVKQKVIRKIYRKEGEDSMGWWWSSEQINELCKKLNLKCEIIEQDKELPHAHYRFDFLISLNNESEN